VVGADAPASSCPSSAWATVVPAMDEAPLWSKLRKIEALHAGSSSDGEREAAPRRRAHPSSACGATHRVAGLRHVLQPARPPGSTSSSSPDAVAMASCPTGSRGSLASAPSGLPCRPFDDSSSTESPAPVPPHVAHPAAPDISSPLDAPGAARNEIASSR